MSPRHASALTMEHILLALLDQKPMHGYELFQELLNLKGISKIWNIKQALLYSDLEKLEERGYIHSKLAQGDSYPPRKVYSLTDYGRDTLMDWIKTPTRRPRDLRQEFLAKIIVAHWYGQQPVLDLLHAQQRTSQSWQEEMNESAPPLDDEHLDEWLVYSFRRTRAEGVSRWLEKLEANLDRLFIDNPPPAA
jgi:PadR family transcriptional regulator AphA